MSSIPYSRYLIRPVTWYSFLIVAGAGIAVFIACRRERECSLPRDTVIDLMLWIFPCGIVGARLYYVIFSWRQFRDDLFSVFRIWEGGLAIYGGIIAGFAALLLFSRRRKLPPLLLCDLIVPGLALAQGIGRWGNWFNIEAYGLTVTAPSLCFFPLAVQVPADGYAWHLATFFYESVWDISVFLFLSVSYRKLVLRQGDSFFLYLFLYAAGRLVIEELRLDSLYAASSVRVSQLLSVLVCIAILIKYMAAPENHDVLSRPLHIVLLSVSAAASAVTLAYSLTGLILSSWSRAGITLYLSLYALLMIITLLTALIPARIREVKHADD